jgi:hypothetical protein
MTLLQRTFLTAVMALLGFGVSTANAQGEFQGTVWSLSYSGLALPDADPLHETYRVTLGVDLAGYDGPASFIDQVALKVSTSVYAASIFDAPGGGSAWTLQAGALSNFGCSGVGSDFQCANSTLELNGGRGASIVDLYSGTDYSWTFDISMNNGALLTAPSGDLSPYMKVRFVDQVGLKSGDLIVEHIALTVPEPETYAMLLVGLGLMGFVARRRQSVSAA